MRRSPADGGGPLACLGLSLTHSLSFPSWAPAHPAHPTGMSFYLSSFRVCLFLFFLLQ